MPPKKTLDWPRKIDLNKTLDAAEKALREVVTNLKGYRNRTDPLVDRAQCLCTLYDDFKELCECELKPDFPEDIAE